MSILSLTDIIPEQLPTDLIVDQQQGVLLPKRGSDTPFLWLERGSMLTEVLNATLTWEQRRAGFWLSDDVDNLTLWWDNKLVARFTIHATVKAIRDEANELMTKAQYE